MLLFGIRICQLLKYKSITIDKGIVLCGHRHGHIIHQLLALTGKRSVTKEVGEYEQGFLTNRGDFVDRKRAAKIASAANQAAYKETLYSEDLY